jgi:dihydrolipoamide dehydrogenase
MEQRPGMESFLTEKTMAAVVYDVAIVGGGPAGYTAAIRAAEYGLKVALIEKDGNLGGTCLHVGCIPTKALLFSAEIWEHFQHAAEYGIRFGAEGIGAPTLDWAAVQRRKNAIIARHAKGLDFLMKKHKIARIEGFGRLTGPAQGGIHAVQVASGEATSQIKAKNVILATGSEAKMLPGLEADDRILTNIEILAIEELPKSLIVVGAGAVGMEFSSIFRSFGAEVTMVEFLPRVVAFEDEEISKELTRLFKKRGIDVNTGARVEKVEKTAAGVKVSFTGANGKMQIKEAEKLLVAVGRAPRTANIGVEKTRIELEGGLIKVNQAQETAEPGVFAIGDIVAGLPQLAHVGAMSGMIAAAKIAGRAYRPVRLDRIPRLRLHRAADRISWADRGAGQGAGLCGEGGQISLCGQLEGHHSRQPRRLCEDRRRCEVRRDSRRSHHRPAGHGADCRSGRRAGVGRHGRGDDVHHPRASHAGRVVAGRLRSRRGNGD